MKDTISWLVSVPASDCNFKLALSRATVDEIRLAISEVEKQDKPPKTKIAALERRLRSYERDFV